MIMPFEESVVAVARPKRKTIVVFVDGWEIEFSEAEARLINEQLARALEDLDLARRLASIAPVGESGA